MSRLVRTTGWIASLALLAAGCATPSAHRIADQVGKEARGKLIDCVPMALFFPPMAVFCLPFLAAAGAAAVASSAGNTEDSGSAPPSQSTYSPTPAPTGESAALSDRFDFVGKTEAGNGLSVGTMYLATNSVARLASGPVSARLVINFDSTSPRGEISHVGDTVTDCASGILTVRSWEGYAQPLGTGSHLWTLEPPHLWALWPPDSMKRYGSEGVFSEAVRMICRT